MLVMKISNQTTMNKLKINNLTLVWGKNLPTSTLFIRDKKLVNFLVNENKIKSVFLKLFNPPLYQKVTRLNKTLSKIPSFWIQMTNQCNMRCKYCYIDHQPLTLKKEVIDNIVACIKTNLLEYNHRSVKIKIAGGEPLLQYKNIYYFVSKVKQEITRKENIKTEIVLLTNGTLLTDQIIQFIKNEKIKVMVSIDGIGKSHDYQRPFVNGNGSHTETMNGINKLLKCGIRPVISIVLTKQNIKDIPSLVEWLYNKKLPFGFNLYRSNKFCNGISEVSLCEFKNTWFKIEKYLIKIALTRNITGNFLDSLLFSIAHEYSCGVGNSYFSFDTEGNVFRCQHDQNIKSSNYLSNTLFDDIKNQQTKWNPKRVDEIEGCKQCNIRYFCAGGCPIQRENNGGSLSGTEYCKIYKFVAQRIFAIVKQLMEQNSIDVL